MGGGSGISDIEMDEIMPPPGLELPETCVQSTAKASSDGRPEEAQRDCRRASALRDAMIRGRGLRNRAPPFVPGPRSTIANSGRGAGGGRHGHSFAKRVATSERKKQNAAK